MFSYLRPHRRSPSTPTSSIPDHQHSLDSSLRSPTDHAHPQLRSRRSFGHFNRSPASPHLPSLPPISGISSSPGGLHNGLTELKEEDVVEGLKTQWESVHGAMSPHETTQLAMCGQADGLQNSRNMDKQNPRSQKGNAAEQSRKLKTISSSHKAPLSILTADDLQDRSSSTGKRPFGMRLPTPPPTAEPANSNPEAVPELGERRKTRLNMLNPMSLLARRRTSQAVPQLAPPQPLNTPNNKSPMLYDPSIRGTKIHDFSAPRARRNVSHSDLSSYKNGKALHDFKSGSEAEESPWSGGNHTPVFKEDFEEEQYPAAGPHVRKANDMTDLHSPNPPYARQSAKSAEQLKPSKPDASDRLNYGPILAQMKPASSSPPPPVQPLPGKETTEGTQVSGTSKSQGATESRTVPAKVPSQKRRSRGISEVSSGDLATLHALPKHMKSTSSRFSFDMIGAAKQEKLLEDRHRQKAAEKKAASPTEEDYDNEGEFNDFDYDGMMDDDGLEERIPGVNADLDEDESEEEDLEPLVRGVTGFTFQSMSAPVTTIDTPTSPYSPPLPTPRDASGQVIGLASSKESPEVNRTLESPSPLSPELQSSQIDDQAFIIDQTRGQGLGLIGVRIDYGSRQQSNGIFLRDGEDFEAPSAFPAPPVTGDDDDLYFDDGIIDIPEDAEVLEFDESVFDLPDTDQWGRPIRPFTQSFGPSPLQLGESNELSPKEESFNLESDSKISRTDEIEVEVGSTTKPELEIDTKSPPTRQPTLSPTVDTVLAPHPSISGLRSLTEPEKSEISKPPTDLTHDSLAAYQSALAEAAFKAAANGKFRRISSPTTTFDERDEFADHPGLVSDSGRQSEELFSPSYDATYDDFNYDDEMDDDEIIAAANAEALAYDCDGFYGQEFGFYSAPPSLPSASGSSEYIHGMGGFFGPRGDDGIMRSMSGRNGMREPNLTPITERSEYSNRNSIMSLQLQGFDVRQSITSPGLAQLAGMKSPYDDETMSLGALMKLRRGAWGDSQVSLHSENSNGSPRSVAGDERQSSSPLSQIPPWKQANGGGGGAGHVRQNSDFSLASDFESRGSVNAETTTNRAGCGSTTAEVDVSAPASPVLMMASVPKKKRRSKEVKSPTYERERGRVSSPSKERDMEREVTGQLRHRKNGSVDSISYMKEEDPIAGEIWVLERRKTSESGESELLGREVIEAGRI